MSVEGERKILAVPKKVISLSNCLSSFSVAFPSILFYWGRRQGKNLAVPQTVISLHNHLFFVFCTTSFYFLWGP